MDIKPRLGQSQPRDTILANMHSQFLGALRQREQDIFHYLTMLAPALGGFFWLLSHLGDIGVIGFVVGTLAVQGLLITGACYSTALGYNYRYITLQIKKIESRTGVSSFILNAWRRESTPVCKKYTLFDGYNRTTHSIMGLKRLSNSLSNIAWCWPPEVIKIYWWSFVCTLIFTSMIASTAVVLIGFSIPLTPLSCAIGNTRLFLSCTQLLILAWLPILVCLVLLSLLALVAHEYGKKLQHQDEKR